MQIAYGTMWFVLLVLATLAIATSDPALLESRHYPRGVRDLTKLAESLSPGASISYNVSSAPRWSEYNAPQPGAVVSVATESDVQKTVQYCLENSVPFFAQSGTHGWQNRFDLNQDGIVINMRGLNRVSFDQNRLQATIQGGAIVKEVIDAAYSSDAILITGNCNCVGALGAGLGGGYGNLAGMFGLSVDNYLSLNVVLADGSARTISPRDDELWWAMRGAGPNFGIVTSAVIKSRPMPKEKNLAWTGIVFWNENQLERLIQAIQDLHLKPNMVIFLYFVTSGPPNFSPAIATTIFYYGSEANGRKDFKSILDIGPSVEMVAITPYNQWNTGGDVFCTKGGRKPSFGVGHDVMNPEAWRSVWEEYKKFVTQNSGTGASAVLAECYSHDLIDRLPARDSFGTRKVKFNSVIIPWYQDKSLDKAALQFGQRARDYLRAADGFGKANKIYVNFATGDESNEVVYQDALPRLRLLKRKYDPRNVFRHWFPIQP